MKILLTNISFANYTGTEVVVRDLAAALLRCGHEPIVFSPTVGRIAEEVRGIGVTVIDDLALLSQAPDLIHGQHHRALAEALLRFPDVPAIYICHDATDMRDEPCFFPRVRRYLAVDERCRLRVERSLGSRAGEIGVMPNAVDLDRFQPRGPLPLQPRRAVIFSNYADRNTHLKAVEAACRMTGLTLDVIGERMGTQSATPERELPRYDIVFAKARCALEALAVGNAVVLCDFGGAGPYVRSENLDHLRRMNFGRGVLTEPLDPKAIARQIRRYDAEDSAKVSRRIRAEAGIESAVAGWIRLYEEVLSGFDPRDVNRTAEYRAFADYLAVWHYARRMDWEQQHLARLRTIPLIGDWTVALALRAYRRWFQP